MKQSKQISHEATDVISYQDIVCISELAWNLLSPIAVTLTDNGTTRLSLDDLRHLEILLHFTNSV